MNGKKTEFIHPSETPSLKKRHSSDTEIGFSVRMEQPDTRKTPSGYKTKQREQILDFLKNANACLSADDIINGLRAYGIPASKPTVYRTLDRFVKNGEISKFVSDKGGCATYRYGNERHGDHFHIKCTECKRTECVDCHFINGLANHFFAHHGFSLSSSRTVFYGLCSDCRQTEAAT